MFAKTLIKLIDYAIFPAVLIMAAKVLGVVFFAKYFDASYSVTGTQISFTNFENFAAVNSYSSLFMFGAVIAGLVWVVVKAHVFHETHIAPSLSSKMYEMNIQDLIHTTEMIFSQAFIWLSFAWLTTIVFGIHAYFDMTYWWVFYIALGVSVVATAAVATDVEREVASDKRATEEAMVQRKIVKFQELASELMP